MTSINIRTFVENNTKNVGMYTSITEAIVNGIHGIEEGGNKDGTIILNFTRANQKNIEQLSEIKSIIVSDNGIGFTDQNFDSFDKIHTDHKIEKGGKGFGRLTFLKFFDDIKVSSLYRDNDSYSKREFNFVNEDEIIDSPSILTGLSGKDNQTNITLNIREKYIGFLDKKLDTIARKLFEKLLVYFIDDTYSCPKIILKDETTEIILNEYLDKHREIQLVDDKNIFLCKDISGTKYEESFKVKVFKVYFTNSCSSLDLVADMRVVKSERLDKFIPEFSEGLTDSIENENGKIVNKDYVIKGYVLGKYLNERVLHDREGFDFESGIKQIGAFKKEEIYDGAIGVIKELFKDDYVSRQDKKVRKIKHYINSKAYWHKPYINQFDYTHFGYSLSEEEMESELQTLKFHLEQKSKRDLTQLLEGNSDSTSEVDKQEIIKNISSSAQSDLIHYVVNRKLVLDYLKNLLKRKDDGSASLEKDLHNVIYPMGRSSNNTEYQEHNLWLLDEKLVFSEHIESDIKISKKGSHLTDKSNKEPDLLIFNSINPYREGDNNISNPITIFEFKRPKRTNYTQDDNPIIQVAKYLKDIRDGKHEMPEGYEKIKANEHTPGYGYIIADINDKIDDFAAQAGLTKSPDDEGYFGYLTGYSMYIEVITYSKLVKDAQQRNKVFFRHLGIE